MPLARARRLIETPLAATVWKIVIKNVLPFRFHDRSGTERSSTDVIFDDIENETLQHRVSIVIGMSTSILVWWRRWRAGA